MQIVKRYLFGRGIGSISILMIITGLLAAVSLITFYSERVLVFNKDVTVSQHAFEQKSRNTRLSNIIPSLEDIALPSETYSLFKRHNFYSMSNEKISVKLKSRDRHVTAPTGRVMSLLKPSETFVVPNIVHYIWFGINKQWKFYQMLSILAAYYFVKPDYIYFHCDHEPVGKWWEYSKKHAKNMIIVPAIAPTKIFKEKLRSVTHKSDIYRMILLYNIGGIYFDTDVIGLKPFHDLRVYNLTLGLEYHPISKDVGEGFGRVNTGILVSAKYPKFFEIWWNTYKNFSDGGEHDYHACVLPYYLQLQYPDLVHVEERTMNYPSGPDYHLLYKQLYDYSNNYAVHLWFENIKGKYNPENIKGLHTTFGQIARSIFYNTTEFIT